jgi:predicted nucleotidyltransferase
MTVSVAAIPECFRDDIERAIRILKTAGCEEVYLFGSLADGDASSGSDIDLAIRGCPSGQFFRLQGKLLMELEHRADLVDLDKDGDLARFLQSELLRVV